MTRRDDPGVRGPWPPDTVRAFLNDSVIPMRIGVQSLTGWPLVLSVWFIADGFDLLGASRSTSMLVRCLEQRPQCAFEVAGDTPPYRGVRGRANVVLDRANGSATLDRLLIRYLGRVDTPLGARLRAHAGDEVCLRLRPLSFVSWDYSARMESSLPVAKDG